jgi:hypothetical protein
MGRVGQRAVDAVLAVAEGERRLVVDEAGDPAVPVPLPARGHHPGAFPVHGDAVRDVHPCADLADEPTCAQVEAGHPVVADVGDQQPSTRLDLDAPWTVQLARPERRDVAATGGELLDGAAVGVRDVHAVGTDGDVLRVAEHVCTERGEPSSASAVGVHAAGRGVGDPEPPAVVDRDPGGAVQPSALVPELSVVGRGRQLGRVVDRERHRGGQRGVAVVVEVEGQVVTGRQRSRADDRCSGGPGGVDVAGLPADVRAVDRPVTRVGPDADPVPVADMVGRHGVGEGEDGALVDVRVGEGECSGESHGRP